MGYITRSNLIVGEISRLAQVNKENTSYELSFIGTTLDCKTTNRSMESTILQLEHVTPADDSGKSWKIQHPEPVCVLTNNVDSGPWPGNTSITYRVAHYQDTLQYWPCLDKEQWIPAINGSGTMDTQYVDFPGAGIHVVVPITETVCYPKIVEYHVTISDALGAQHTSYVIKDDISMPVYTKYLENFDGNLTQFAQLSDALVIYRDFSMNLNQSGTGFVGNNFDGNLTQFAQLSDALVIHRDFSMNLNQSGTGFVGNNFEYPSMSNETKSYRNENGTVVETCMLKTVLTDETKITDSPQDIWPLGVFERRLHQRDMYYSCPAFDPDMANELLINTTISALSLNQRFDMVNGTETRGFNAYRFENKLAFFLPYGLSLTLAVPILALGFIALYVQNHGVSAISGGFLQLLMTTTGRTSPEAVVTKGSGTLGGYENVSNELREMEVRFGELIEVKGDDLKETDTLLSGHEGHADMQDVDRPQSDIETASGTERREQSASVVRRAGFGTVHEVGPFRKKGEL
ncbi:hypothetical protein AA0119_g11947 [Alternaria tenuissima]|uniref:Uncharacterized protein n=1 Tax=Alternaria tenuissima TaxID=119927 RepID=A0ABY0FSQ4_9PLEO|nr:hypothetical protein AA0119_g11947 [Alternaria tenuissima]RYO07038.1 hypothetical protein AA0121_g11845 [Alternaria tenuissima]RYO62401.1 hypothetical protein AA0116_g5151 [Alternaria tenuissima]